MTKTFFVAILSAALVVPGLALAKNCYTCRSGALPKKIQVVQSLGKGLYEVNIVYDDETVVIRLNRTKPTDVGQTFGICMLEKESTAKVVENGFSKTIPIVVEDSRGCTG